MENNDLTCLSCMIAESVEAHKNLSNPVKCQDAARYFVREYCSRFVDKPLDFESFLKWLATEAVYQEYFGLHFVRAWNDEMKRRGQTSMIAPLAADELYVKYLRHRPFLNCIEPKEPEPMKKKPSSMKSPVVIAAIIIAFGAIVTAFIVRSRPASVQKRFQKLNNFQILNVETGEVKRYN